MQSGKLMPGEFEISLEEPTIDILKKCDVLNAVDPLATEAVGVWRSRRLPSFVSAETSGTLSTIATVCVASLSEDGLAPLFKILRGLNFGEVLGVGTI